MHMHNNAFAKKELVSKTFKDLVKKKKNHLCDYTRLE